MKNFFKKFFVLWMFAILGILFFWRIPVFKKKKEALHVGISADYPPFAFYQEGALKGFDVDLAKALGKKMKKKVMFAEMPSSTLISALQNQRIDMVISATGANTKRRKNFDFTEIYYKEPKAILVHKKSGFFKKLHGIASFSPQKGWILHQKKLCWAGNLVAAAQGSILIQWLHNMPANCRPEILSIDHYLRGVEMLKAQQVEGVFLNESQGKIFQDRYPFLVFFLIKEHPLLPGQSDDSGYRGMTRKNDPLCSTVEKIFRQFKKEGLIDVLKKRYGLKG